MATPKTYFERPKGFFMRKRSKKGTEDVQLSNFLAHIVTDITVDTGDERGVPRRLFEIEASLRGAPRRFTVSTETFQKMSWVSQYLGARAIVHTANGASSNHLRVAIQKFSKSVQEKTVFGHLGWHKVNGHWIYLHNEGAIGADGAIRDLNVEVTPELRNFVLPAPTSGGAKAAATSSLMMLDVAPPRVALPLLAAVWRAVLGEADFSLHIAGKSGTRKSELAALVQRHFGAAMDSRNLPCSWHSTANALEALAFEAKDAVLVVDDFAPNSPGADRNELAKASERLFRSAGNRAGRHRLSSSSSIKAAKMPRCLVLSTGEELPEGLSIRSRMLVLRVLDGDVDLGELTHAQGAAAGGALAQATSHFIKWLAPRYDATLATMNESRVSYRNRARRWTTHGRTPDIIGSLAAAFDVFLEFAHQVGATNSDGAETLRKSLWQALEHVAHAQRGVLGAADPPARFLALLGAAVRSGDAHVASLSGGPPEKPEQWGWVQDHASGGLRPAEDRVGWLEGSNLYLDFDAAYDLAKRVGDNSGEPLRASAIELRKKMNEQGLLVSVEEKRETLFVRRVIEGERRDVIHLAARSLAGPEGSR